MMDLVLKLLVIYLVIGLISWGVSCIWWVWIILRSRKDMKRLDKEIESIKDMD